MPDEQAEIEKLEAEVKALEHPNSFPGASASVISSVAPTPPPQVNFTGLLGVWGQAANFGVVAVLTLILMIKIVWLDPAQMREYLKEIRENHVENTNAIDRMADKHADAINRLVQQLNFTTGRIMEPSKAAPSEKMP